MIFLYLLFNFFFDDVTIRVCILETTSRVKLDFKHVAILSSNEGRYQLSQFNEDFFVYVMDSMIYFEGSGSNPRFFKFKNDLSFSLSPAKESDLIIVNDRFHEAGKLEFFIENGNLQIISHVPLNRYLKYVVPNEILTQRDSDYSAIVAQTIAARTYALNSIKNSHYFDVYSDVRDQVYLSGIDVDLKVIKAIDESSEQVITFQNKLIDAKYCSSLGGRAERPIYLDSLTEFQSSISIEGEFIGQISPFFRWKLTFSKHEIIELFQGYFKDEMIKDSLIENQLKFAITARSATGRIIEMDIRINQRQYILKQLEIRRFFSKNKQILPSTLFYMEFKNDTVAIYGAGNGHGIGMGQWEAIDLSRRHYNYYQILDFFYPYTEVKSYKSIIK